MNNYTKIIWDKLGARGILMRIAILSAHLSSTAFKLIQGMDVHDGNLSSYKRDQLVSQIKEMLTCYYVLCKFECEENGAAYTNIKRWAEQVTGKEDVQ